MIRHLQEPPLHIKIHGLAPYQAVLIHGGPGAAGEMAPLAVDLAANRGILEPHQTASSVAGQVSELISVIEQWGDPPVVLVGFSWGECAAWKTDHSGSMQWKTGNWFTWQSSQRVSHCKFLR